MRNAVVLTADRPWLPPAIWLWHELRRLNPRADTDVILISDEEHPSLWGTPVPAGHSIAVKALGLPPLDYPTHRRITAASFWRIAAPDALAGRYAKLLYMDIDVLPVGPELFECFDYDLGDAPLAACQSVHSFQSGLPGPVAYGKFSFKRYLNSGVLLINVPAFVAAGVADRAFAIVEREGANLGLLDQTALNLALDNDWLDLSLAYNFWPGALGTFVEALRPPRLLHYYGNYKPWHPISPYPSGPSRRRLIAELVRRGAGQLLFRQWGLRTTLRDRHRRIGHEFVTERNGALLNYLRQPALGDTATV